MRSLPNFKSLVIADAARKDLASIARYTKKTWGEKQKKQYMFHLKTDFSELCINTKIGKSCDDLYPQLQSYKSQKHIIFYLVKSDVLHIVRVLHQSMDIEKHLN